ncbi:MAG: hypothetical protein J7484_11925 [Microbacterium sp.]|nr:hypothetical protein [Microbacterium sp.]
MAIALPAVVLALVLGIGALSAAARQVSLQDAAADAARVLGRGEEQASAARIVRTAVPDAVVSSRSDGDLVCATASVDVAIAGSLRLPLQASSCALSGGR